MENQEQNFTKKQLRELRRQKKTEKRESEENKKRLSRIIIWSFAVLIIGGTITLMAGFALPKTSSSNF